jgi:hypothetical protein
MVMVADNHSLLMEFVYYLNHQMRITDALASAGSYPGSL